jgi:hypothetical protein
MSSVLTSYGDQALHENVYNPSNVFPRQNKRTSHLNYSFRNMASKDFEHLKSLLTETEIITPTSSSYKEESGTWASQCDQSPTLVLRPRSVQSLSKILAFLNTTSLNFSIRSQGFGNASAKDVLISLTAFDEFSYDAENETVILGAGQTWGDYYKKMENAAPDRSIVACRTPNIGVGGSTLGGGFSWLSGEFGCLSDPVNMLDAQVVKLDGSVIWASEEPDLLWALRGATPGLGGKTFRPLYFNSRKKLTKRSRNIIQVSCETLHPEDMGWSHPPTQHASDAAANC